MTGNVLIVDDDQSMCEMMEADLRLRNYNVSWRTSADDAMACLKKNEFDVVIADLNMPGVSGIDLCRRIVEDRPDIPVIVITGFGSMETAVAAIRAGAYDFITKPVEMDMLAISLERAVERRAMQEKIKILTQSVDEFQRYDEIIGSSVPMKALYDQLERIVDSDASVLITGETGTGKELVARALHNQSRRSNGPFVAVNCAALPETLIESELFGHTRGAFTDARMTRKGLILEAGGGTLFLDEIGEFPMALQPKLLRVLEERTLRPVGGESEKSFDVRIVAATSRDLESAIEDGTFREDLFFRINVIPIVVPSLRSRGTDVLLLAGHFLEKYAKLSGKPVKGISPAVVKKLLSYAWPGNVRELRNTIEHAVALTRSDTLILEDLPEKIQNADSSKLIIANNDPADLVSMEAIEKLYVDHVLKTVGGNKTVAAKILGFDRKTLYRKLKRHALISDSET